MTLAEIISQATALATTFGAMSESLLSAGTKTQDLIGWLMPQIRAKTPELSAPPGEAQIVEALLALMESEAFMDQLDEKIRAASPELNTQKNIVTGSLSRIKTIRIGDKTYDTTQTYHRKNIVEGDVSEADSFTLGDGH